MSRSKHTRSASKAAALQYGAKNNAPVLVASGMGYMAEKIVEVASDNGVPIYEDDSLATVLTQLQLGQEIPEELYQAIVEIYVYFLHFDPGAPSESSPASQEEQPPAAPEKPPVKEQSEGIHEEEGEK
jgi:flagellar biosynthesis protein